MVRSGTPCKNQFHLVTFHQSAATSERVREEEEEEDLPPSVINPGLKGGGGETWEEGDDQHC